ncbi:DUF393 domain-containing protein [Elizabethkingia argentiflava]|uniref:DUF393 domain-containing protein n=1 Tax=Elizabethkingia argenteiflava TaxID=2681556 RepID=A0A845PUD0_9FLAO|nr:DCC1-like thiol-disulfide oxidoreductase family protein [Elizabethkingia argenteiflava]NAW50506.1 DUF393 domain-containing protein [Elizabethkingia argenteiflava]
MHLQNKHIVLYDGDCPYCNYWVKFILNHDNQDKFMFATLQSDFGQDFLKKRNLDHRQFTTIYLLKPHEYYLIKSTAIFKILSLIGGIYLPLSWLRFFPRFICDKLYDFVSRNRKKMNVKSCPILTHKEREKFLTDPILF